MGNKKKIRYPWIPIYAEAFVASTAHMSNETVGCYMRLLMYQVINGGIPDDEESVKNICGGNATAYAKLVKTKFFVDENGLLQNKRMAEEMEKRDGLSKKNKKNAHIRWGSHSKSKPSKDVPNGSDGNAIAYAKSMPPHMPEPCDGGVQIQIQDKALTTRAREVEKNGHGFKWPTLQEVLEYSKGPHCLGCTPECSEMFWNDMEACGWVSKNGRHVSDWRAALRAYWNRWKNNDLEKAARNSAGQKRGGKRMVPRSTFEGEQF